MKAKYYKIIIDGNDNEGGCLFLYIKKRIITKIGDVSCVAIDGKYKKYLQYIVNDLTQLNSDVVRVFKELYPIEVEPELSEVIKGDVDFYAHCVVSAGIKRGLWEKVDNVKDVGETKHILFKIKKDFSSSEKLDDWEIWNINVGKSYGFYAEYD